jgi:hypothetical protein
MSKFYLSDSLTSIALSGSTVGMRAWNFDDLPGAPDSLDGSQFRISLQAKDIQDLQWTSRAMDQTIMGADDINVVTSFVIAFKAMLDKIDGGRAAINANLLNTNALVDIAVAAYENKLPGYMFSKSNLATIVGNANVSSHDENGDLKQIDGVDTLESDYIFSDAQIKELYYSFTSRGYEEEVDTADGKRYTFQNSSIDINDFIGIKMEIKTAETTIHNELLPDDTTNHTLSDGSVKFSFGFMLVAEGQPTGLIEIVHSAPAVSFVRSP